MQARYRLLAFCVVTGFVLMGTALYIFATTPGLPSDVAVLDPGFAPEGLALRAEDEDSGGVSPGSTFVLSSASDMTAEEVQAALSVEPAVPYSVERSSSREFRLRPGEVLAEETLYRFEFKGGAGQLLDSWAFQVQAPLRVAGTIPDADRTNVPINAGIEITFNQDGVRDAERFVEIFPPTEGHFEQHNHTLVFVPRTLEPATIYTVRVNPGLTLTGSNRLLDEAYVLQFETGLDSRGGRPEPVPAFTSRVNSASSNEAPIVGLTSAPNADTQVEVFAYRDLEAFLRELDRLEALPPWAAYAQEALPVDTSALTRVASFLPVPEPGVAGAPLVTGTVIPPPLIAPPAGGIAPPNTSGGITPPNTTPDAPGLIPPPDGVGITPPNTPGAPGLVTPPVSVGITPPNTAPGAPGLVTPPTGAGITPPAPAASPVAPVVAAAPVSLQPWVRFPEPLAPGFYLVRLSGPAPRQAWLQVTDLAAYVSLSTTRTLVWLNDTASAGPVPGASVSDSKGVRLASSDADGIALFDTPAGSIQAANARTGAGMSARGYLVIRDQQGRAHVAPLSTTLSSRGRYQFLEYSPALSGDYWALLNTDRPLYQPTDTVHFWGIARPRDSDTRVEVEVDLTGYSENGTRVRLAAPVTLKTSATGSFEGEIAFEGLATGYYQLEVRHQGKPVRTASIGVETYTKPTYRLGLATDRTAYIAGDPIALSMEAGFFEGTPVGGLALSVNGMSTPAGAGVTTGEDGRARMQTTAVMPDGYRDFYSAGLSVRPSAPEEAEIDAYVQVAVFPAAVGLTASSEFKDSVITLRGKAFEIDAGRVRDWSDLYFRPAGAPAGFPAYASGPAAAQDIELQVTRISYRKTETGEAYDYINKTTRKTYSYERLSQSIETLTVSSDPDGSFVYTLPTEPDQTYEVQLSTLDSAGRSARLQTYAFSRQTGPRSLSMNLWLGFTDRTQSAQRQFEIGDRVAVSLTREAENLPSGAGNRYLFYQAQRGIFDYGLQDSPDFAFNFSDRQVPSVTIKAVYFNGSTYLEPGYEGSGYVRVDFNPEARRAYIGIEPDKDEYVPGETATIAVRVTDGFGRPLQAEVNLSAVDEALFALREVGSYQLDVLTRLYEPVGSGIIRTYASHPLLPPPAPPVAAPRTGGESLRDDFEDTALFETVATGSDGRASVTFELPDNLTSWRVTALAYGAGLTGGYATGHITVKRDFFVDAKLGKSYLTGEQPYLRLSGYGDALTSSSLVQFEVTAPSLGWTAPLRVESSAFRPVDLQLPPLAEGLHDLTVRATSAGFSDTLVREVEVVESRIRSPQARYYETPPEDGAIEGSASGRTTVSFYDSGRGRFYGLLSELVRAGGDRLDQALARLAADGLLSRYFGEPSRGYAFDAGLYLRPAGSQAGVALVPFGGPDLKLTARVAAIAPDVFGRNALDGYLAAAASGQQSTAEERAIALYGLASLGRPVLPALRALEGDPALGWRGRLYLALGYHAAGDGARAKAVYQQSMEDGGEELAPFWRLRAGADEDSVLEATALAAILGAAVGDQRAYSLFEYVEANSPRDAVLSLDRISFAAYGLARAPIEPVEFEYSAGGPARRVQLKGGVFSVSLSPAELRELRYRVDKGRVSIATSFFAAGDAPAAAPAGDLAISRSYSNVANSPVFDETQLVRITIDYRISPQAPDGCYVITDTLPSGLVPVRRPATLRQGFGDAQSPFRVEGQAVSFCVDKSSRAPLVYFARPIGRGAFTAEPAIIYSMGAPSLRASTPASVVRID